MKLFIVLSAVVALALAQSQDSSSSTGGYQFGYNDGQSSRQEVQSADGVVRGAYSFIDANGVVQTVRYTADALNGFQVVEPSKFGLEAPFMPMPIQTSQFDVNGIPLPVADTPEVMAAKLAHFEAIRRAQGAAVPQYIVASPSLSPQVVADTPEVMAARIAHLKAVQQAQIASRPVIQAPTLNNHFEALRQFAPIPQVSLSPINEQTGQVQYTPEVAAARSAHFLAVNAALRQNGRI